MFLLFHVKHPQDVESFLCIKFSRYVLDGVSFFPGVVYISGGLFFYEKGFAMKVSINIDCTPEEARKFLGLPDIVPLQSKMMKELEARLQENVRSLDPETLVKTWLPATIQGWSEMQKVFWSQMGTSGSSATAPDKNSPK